MYGVKNLSVLNAEKYFKYIVAIAMCGIDNTHTHTKLHRTEVHPNN
jgi:hypothetical protein